MGLLKVNIEFSLRNKETKDDLKRIEYRLIEISSTI